MERGDNDALFEQGGPLSSREKALYIQGVRAITTRWQELSKQCIQVILHSGCVQMSEAVAHFCMAVAKHPHGWHMSCTKLLYCHCIIVAVQAKLQADPSGPYLDHVIAEVIDLVVYDSAFT